METNRLVRKVRNSMSAGRKNLAKPRMRWKNTVELMQQATELISLGSTQPLTEISYQESSWG
jgi:hypothetical protein